MDELLRTYIDKTCAVFKLKIALCNCDVKAAQHNESLASTAKFRENQAELVKEFKQWKQGVKARYARMTETPEVMQELRRRIKHVELMAAKVCDDIEQKENEMKKNNIGHLSDTLKPADASNNGRRSPSWGRSNTNDKYPMTKEEYNRRLSIPLEEHLKSARSLSRAEITSDIRTDITDHRHDDAPLFSKTWAEFTSYFLAENRTQHVADRLIEITILQFVEFYWKEVGQFVAKGLVAPDNVRLNRQEFVKWTQEKLAALEKLTLKPFPLPKKLEETMRDYIRLINDAVVDIVYRILQCTLFDALRTSKIAQFCDQPTIESFNGLVIDEITKDYGFFNTRQVDTLAKSQTHLERLKNEPTLPANRWMLAKVRTQHEIEKLNCKN